jgi:hypothetical protein
VIAEEALAWLDGAAATVTEVRLVGYDDAAAQHFAAGL